MFLHMFINVKVFVLGKILFPVKTFAEHTVFFFFSLVQDTIFLEFSFSVCFLTCITDMNNIFKIARYLVSVYHKCSNCSLISCTFELHLYGHQHLLGQGGGGGIMQKTKNAWHLLKTKICIKNREKTYIQNQANLKCSKTGHNKLVIFKQ